MNTQNDLYANHKQAFETWRAKYNLCLSNVGYFTKYNNFREIQKQITTALSLPIYPIYYLLNQANTFFYRGYLSIAKLLSGNFSDANKLFIEALNNLAVVPRIIALALKSIIAAPVMIATRLLGTIYSWTCDFINFISNKITSCRNSLIGNK